MNQASPASRNTLRPNRVVWKDTAIPSAITGGEMSEAAMMDSREKRTNGSAESIATGRAREPALLDRRSFLATTGSSLMTIAAVGCGVEGRRDARSTAVRRPQMRFVADDPAFVYSRPIASTVGSYTGWARKIIWTRSSLRTER